MRGVFYIIYNPNPIDMKYIINFLIILIFFGINELKAQEECATVMAEEQLNWLRHFRSNEAPSFKKSDETYYIPIQIHSVGTDEGVGYFTKKSSLQLMCDLNSYFANSGSNMQFFLHNNDILYIANSNYYEHSGGTGTQMMNNNNVNNVVNIYVVADPSGACGYFSYGGDAIALAKNCADAGASTLTHEIGHYFSLPHTFFGWEYVEEGEELPISEREKVIREGATKNCHTTADLFCDTDPDYAAYRWNCPFGDEPYVDPDGVSFVPDGTLFMSYSLCRGRFSQEQMDAMEANLLFQRSDLLNSTQELNFADIYTTTTQFPAAFSQNVPYQNAYFQWSPVDNVNFYNLHVYNFQGYNVDILIEDNFYTLTDLEPDVTYYWEVIVYNDGNYCVPAETFNGFKTSETSTFAPSILNVEQPLCYGEATGSIFIEIMGGTPPYTYIWEDGTEGQTLENLPAGKYNLTVTDANDISEIIGVEVGESDELTLNLIQTGATVEAFVSGGRPPYTTSWSNGNEGTVNTVEIGANEITIIDDNDCELFYAFNALNIEAEITNIACKGEENGSITLTETLGGNGIYTYDWNNGEDSTSIQNLSTGTYEVQISEEGINDITSIFSFEIMEPEEILEVTVIVNENNVTCEATGGNAPYSILWSNGNTDAILTNAIVGMDSLMVVDANNCSKMVAYTVLGIEAEITNILCKGEETGQIEVAAMGGVEPYIFEWSNGTNNNVLENVAADTYTVEITDANGATNAFIYEIVEPTEALNLTVDVEGLTVTAIPTNGVEPYEYIWSNDATEETVTFSEPDVYTVQVIDANDCVATHEFAVIESDLDDLNTASIQLYPNPTNESVNIKIPVEYQDAFVSIYNSMGQLIYQEKRTGNQLINIPVQQWATGLYFVELQIGENKISQKLIVD